MRHRLMFSIRSWLQKSSLLVVLGLGLVAVTGCDSAGQSQTQTEETESTASLDTVMATGTFDGKEGISTSGTYEIGQADEDLILVLTEDFQTETGPDLYVVLSPKEADDATGNNVLAGSAQRIHSLRALSGEQRYDLADDLDVDSFSSVAIQCVQFSHLYGAADL